MSRKRVFLVAVDVLDPTFDLEKIKEIFRKGPAITGWWNYIPGCFLVKSDLSVDDLTDRIRTATHDARLLVMEVNPTVSEGWLPESSWNWIRRRETEDAN